MSATGTFTLGDCLEGVERALRLRNDADVALAVRRIDAQHRALCALTDWERLRRRLEVASDGATLEISSALGISAVSVAATGAPYWYCERWDVAAADLAGRRLWSSAMPAAAVEDDGDFAAVDFWDWNTETEVHVPSDEVGVAVDYWRRPDALWSVATVDGEEVFSFDRTTPLALPEARALVVRVVLDVIGLQGRAETDAGPWRQELEPSLQMLLARHTRAPGAGPLRLPSGRLLARAPVAF